MHKEYDTGFFWWEPVETMRKLFLTGILLWLVPEGEEFKRMIFATLVSIISMFDIVGMIRGPILASTEWNGVYWELFGFACVLFFVVCYGISQYSQWLERELQTDHR